MVAKILVWHDRYHGVSFTIFYVIFFLSYEFFYLQARRIAWVAIISCLYPEVQKTKIKDKGSKILWFRNFDL